MQRTLHKSVKLDNVNDDGWLFMYYTLCKKRWPFLF